MPDTTVLVQFAEEGGRVFVPHLLSAWGHAELAIARLPQGASQ